MEGESGRCSGSRSVILKVGWASCCCCCWPAGAPAGANACAVTVGGTAGDWPLGRGAEGAGATAAEGKLAKVEEMWLFCCWSCCC